MPDPGFPRAEVIDRATWRRFPKQSPPPPQIFPDASTLKTDCVGLQARTSRVRFVKSSQIVAENGRQKSKERHIILHAKKSLLYNTGEPWGKKTTSNLFDVTMGSYDGAESCELVGAYLLHIIKEKHGYNFGLYRDDGLGITQASPRQAERIKKDLCNIFGKHGLKITIEANKKIVNFLDVTLNLSSILRSGVLFSEQRESITRGSRRSGKGRKKNA